MSAYVWRAYFVLIAEILMQDSLVLFDKTNNVNVKDWQVVLDSLLVYFDPADHCLLANNYALLKLNKIDIIIFHSWFKIDLNKFLYLVVFFGYGRPERIKDRRCEHIQSGSYNLQELFDIMASNINILDEFG